MAASYTEKRDSQGRVRIALASHMPGWVWSVPVLVPIAFYIESEGEMEMKTAVFIGLGLFAVLVAWFFIRRQSIGLLINPGARTLAVVDGPKRGRVLKMDDVQQALVRQVEVDEGDTKVTLHRVELMLRSSEILPLMGDRGSARFRPEDCQRLAVRINMALRAPGAR